MPARGLALLGSTAILAGTAAPAVAQDVNIPHTIEYVEGRLLQQPLEVLDMAQARPMIAGDRSARVQLGGVDGAASIFAKWKPVGRNAQGFNNEPRYELAAYHFQRLFLDEPDFVVPPTVLRSKSLEEYTMLRPASQPTLRGTASVLFLLAYWVDHVTNRDPFAPDRFAADSVYARHWANLNILTHLIDHKDANVGNLLISIDPGNPRVFSVDNDVAFRSRASDRGDDWRHLQVDRLPAHTIERLRTVTRADLDRVLGVVAEFDIVDGLLVAAQPGENLNPGRGVRVTGEKVQFGLTANEIRDIERRIERLLNQVDRGRISTF